jgi:hypothetical protein
MASEPVTQLDNLRLALEQTEAAMRTIGRAIKCARTNRDIALAEGALESARNLIRQDLHKTEAALLLRLRESEGGTRGS